MSDRPTNETDEIEVTPEMAKAGARVLIDYHPQIMDWLTLYIATEIYRAMRIYENPREEDRAELIELKGNVIITAADATGHISLPKMRPERLERLLSQNQKSPEAPQLLLDQDSEPDQLAPEA